MEDDDELVQTVKFRMDMADDEGDTEEAAFMLSILARIRRIDATPCGWVQAADHEMVCAHLGIASMEDTYSEARAKLHQIIQWHVAVATDPALQGETT